MSFEALDNTCTYPEGAECKDTLEHPENTPFGRTHAEGIKALDGEDGLSEPRNMVLVELVHVISNSSEVHD